MAKPEVLCRSVVWQGDVETIEAVDLILPGGSRQTRVVTSTRPGAVIAVVNERRQIALQEFYRFAVDAVLYELPAGKIDPGDTPLQGAARELVEETGLTAGRWTELGISYGAQGSSNWECHYFLAEDLTQTDENREPHEDHIIHWVALDCAWRWVVEGRIRNNFTTVGIMKALVALGALPRDIS